MRSIKWIPIISAVLMLPSISLQAQTPPQYNVTVLPAPTGDCPKGNCLRATSLNNLGQVIGLFYNQPTADQSFLYSNGTTINISSLLNNGSNFATDINDDGVITGYAFFSYYAQSGYRAFMLDSRTGLTTYLGPLDSFGSAINNAGQAVGYSEANGFYPLLFMNGEAIAFYDEQYYGSAVDINDQYGSDGVGQIIGNDNANASGFLYTNGETIYPAVCPEANGITLVAINNAGQVVGECNYEGSPKTGFIYNSNSSTVAYINIGPASDINDAGWIVGAKVTEGDKYEYPYLIINGTVYNLYDLVPLGTVIKLGEFVPIAINNQGQILVQGDIEATGALLLTPVGN